MARQGRGGDNGLLVGRVGCGWGGRIGRDGMVGGEGRDGADVGSDGSWGVLGGIEVLEKDGCEGRGGVVVEVRDDSDAVRKFGTDVT